MDASVEAALAAISRRLGVEVGLRAAPEAASLGFDTAIWLVDLDGDDLAPAWQAPLVLRIHPSSDRLDLAHREAAVHTFLSAAGFPVPKVLAVFGRDEGCPLPVQVMDRMAGTTMLPLIEKSPWHAPTYFSALGRLHVQLHALPSAEWPFPEESDGSNVLADRRLHLPRRLVAEQPAMVAGLAEALAEIDRTVLPKLANAEVAVCHGDLHPLNVMVDGDEMSVIDWTDACVGDRHGDVARLVTLMREAAAGAPTRLQRMAVRFSRPVTVGRYLKAYAAASSEAGLPALDTERLRHWEPVHLAHDWARSALTLADPAQADRVHPRTLEWVKARLRKVLRTL